MRMSRNPGIEHPASLSWIYLHLQKVEVNSRSELRNWSSLAINIWDSSVIPGGRTMPLSEDQLRLMCVAAGLFLFVLLFVLFLFWFGFTCRVLRNQGYLGMMDWGHCSVNLCCLIMMLIKPVSVCQPKIRFHIQNAPSGPNFLCSRSKDGWMDTFTFVMTH